MQQATKQNTDQSQTDEDQIYRAIQQADGRPRQDNLILYTIVVNEDRSNDHKDLSRPATQVRKNPEYSLASHLIPEQSHARGHPLHGIKNHTEKSTFYSWKGRRKRRAIHANIHGRGAGKKKKRTTTPHNNLHVLGRGALDSGIDEDT